MHARVVQLLKARYDAMWEALPQEERDALEGKAPTFDGKKLLEEFVDRMDTAKQKRADERAAAEQMKAAGPAVVDERNR